MSSWTPNSFRREGERRGYADGYLDALVAEGRRLRGLSVPVLFTLGHLAEICDAPYQFLNEIVRRKSDPYRAFQVRKRNGGYRLITVPEAPLLSVQRWIHQNILSTRTPHPASTAYAPKCGPRTNASLHAGARWLVKLDVMNFFEAVSERQVFRVFRDAGYPALLAFQLTRLCTRVASRSRKYGKRRWQSRALQRYEHQSYGLVGYLPQGAPTSPMLANLVCRTLDGELEGLAQQHDCSYSRYADDIVFSALRLTRGQAATIIHSASAILGGHGFTRNRQKTQISPPGARRVVTGLLVDGDAPRLTRAFRERVELHLYHAAKSIHDHCQRRKFRSLLGFRAHLDGLVTYGEHIDSSLGAKWRAEFDALPWGELQDFGSD